MKSIIKSIVILSLATALPAAAQNNLTQKLDSVLYAYANIKEFNGSALIAIKGKVVLAKGYGFADLKTKRPNTANTIFGIASITKTFTAAMILKLAEENKLSLNDAVSKYFPDFKQGRQITVANLLSHTSGINDLGIQNKTNAYQTTGFNRAQLLIVGLNASELAFSPGTAFGYSNNGYYLLGNIISKVTKITYEQAIRNYVFKPFGLQNSGFDFMHLPAPIKAKGYRAEEGKDYNKETILIDSVETYAAGSIYSNVLDLYKWHRILQDHKFVSRNSLNMAYQQKSRNYGYGWQLDSLMEKQIVSHSGGFPGFRSNFVRIPKDDITIILLSNNEVPGLDMITRVLVSALYGQPYELPVEKKFINLTPNQLQKYVGVYEIPDPNLVLEVKLENGQLNVYPENGMKSELLPQNDTQFFDKKQQGIVLIFGNNGIKDTMTILMNGTRRTAIKK